MDYKAIANGFKQYLEYLAKRKKYQEKAAYYDTFKEIVAAGKEKNLTIKCSPEASELIDIKDESNLEELISQEINLNFSINVGKEGKNGSIREETLTQLGDDDTDEVKDEKKFGFMFALYRKLSSDMPLEAVVDRFKDGFIDRYRKLSYSSKADLVKLTDPNCRMVYGINAHGQLIVDCEYTGSVAKAVYPKEEFEMADIKDIIKAFADNLKVLKEKGINITFRAL